MLVTTSLLSLENEYQWSVSDIWSFLMDTQKSGQWLQLIITILDAFMSKNATDNITTVCKK